MRKKEKIKKEREKRRSRTHMSARGARWSVVGTAFSSGLITYVWNSGGFGQEGIARLLKSTDAFGRDAAQLCGEALLFKGMERNRSGERPTSRADPATVSPLPSAMRPAAVCCDSQRAAGLCHLASRRIPRTHIGNPNYATSLRLPLP